MIPRAIIWNDGRVFEIEKVISYYPAASTEKGMSGNCYTVIIRGKTRMLYFQRSPKEYISQTGRWYVEVPA